MASPRVGSATVPTRSDSLDRLSTAGARGTRAHLHLPRRTPASRHLDQPGLAAAAHCAYVRGVTEGQASPAEAGLRYGDPAGRWVLAATVMGTAVAFLDATVVNIALPAIRGDLDAGVAGLTWTVNGYTLTL